MGQKTTADKGKKEVVADKNKKTAGKAKPPVQKSTLAADWSTSLVTEELLKGLVEEGVLPPQSEIKWRVPGKETRPEPREGEVIVFADHVTRGFRPPGSKFFRSVLHVYKLHPQDLSANSVLNICHFQTFCEAFLQMKPTMALFAEFYYCNKQTEYSGGPALECGAVTIQKRAKSIFPAPKLLSKVKNWHMSFFYCTVKTPDDEHPYPSFRDDQFAFHDGLNLIPSGDHKKKIEPVIRRMKALLAHGLIGTDLTRCWVSWQIQPLSVRDRLMCEYTGRGDSMCFAQNEIPSAALVTACKKFLAERIEDIKRVGLLPFCQANPAPPVCVCYIFAWRNFFVQRFDLPTPCFQENDPWWSVDHDPTAEETDVKSPSHTVRIT